MHIDICIYTYIPKYSLFGSYNATCICFQGWQPVCTHFPGVGLLSPPSFLGCLQFFVQSWGSVFRLTGKTVSHGQLQLHALTATPPPLPDEYRRTLPLKYGQPPHLDFPSLWLSLLCFPCHQNFPFECIAPISFQMWWFCPQEQKISAVCPWKVLVLAT